MIFLSYSSDNSFEAGLLQFAYEAMLEEKVWTYERDQARDEKEIANNLMNIIKDSNAVIFLVTPSTIDKCAAQWMELAYAHAFDVPTFILLHQLTYADLISMQQGVPPLLRAAKCNLSGQWREVAEDYRNHCKQHCSRACLRCSGPPNAIYPANGVGWQKTYEIIADKIKSGCSYVKKILS